jgi:hypothetical protein
MLRKISKKFDLPQAKFIVGSALQVTTGGAKAKLFDKGQIELSTPKSTSSLRGY